jgi:hypothetical protein
MCYINKAWLYDYLVGYPITMDCYEYPKLCKRLTLLLNICHKVITRYHGLSLLNIVWVVSHIELTN